MIMEEIILKDSYNLLGQYIAFFIIPSRPTDTKFWQWYNLPKGRSFMLRPHRNTSTTGAYLCITMPARGQLDAVVEYTMENGTEDTKRMLYKYFAHAGWESARVLEGMDHADDFHMSQIAQVKLSKWTNGRTLVLGDATWATFGVGTTLAIEGAYVLAGELSKIHSSSDIPQALERYKQVFRPIYAKMEDISPFFPQYVFPQTTWDLCLRNSALWVVNKTNMYKLFQGGSEMKEKLPSYDWTGI
jgi:2-polyprenyl-6-methoxyphenol hydroxylase-like FAD-dependent oxidoreductase